MQMRFMSLFSLLLHAASRFDESIKGRGLCQRRPVEPHRHHDSKQDLRSFGAEAYEAGKPEDGQGLRRLVYAENVLLSIRQFLRLHLLHRFLQGEVPRVFQGIRKLAGDFKRQNIFYDAVDCQKDILDCCYIHLSM